MSESIYTTNSGSANPSPVGPSLADERPAANAPGDGVVSFTFNSTKFMVTPLPEEGNAAGVTMEGQSMAIQVATVYFASSTLVAETQWETPFCGRPPEWKSTLLDLVLEHYRPVSVGVEQ